MTTLKKTPLDIEQLAHELIKDDLRNCQFIYGFHQLKIDASNYLLHLSETVFLVLGYQKEDVPEPVWDVYYNFTRKKASIRPDELNESLDELASEILGIMKQMIRDIEPSTK